ncbi:hypothetical protein RUM43_007117 [Polyplax serrata]|uniref:Immunoglobulin-like beta-sandwich domain-containing protein n=1 Tax=Polyplax serrata TaxID=468196 RepID=A0AAN8Q5P4_POLSC
MYECGLRKKKDAALNDGEKRKWVGIDRRRNEEVKAIKKVMKEVINRESSGRETPPKKRWRTKLSRKPQPHVWWWKGETLIDSTDKPGGFANVMNNQLVVSELSRYDLHSVYTCQAFNTNITQPVQTSVTVEMYRGKKEEEDERVCEKTRKFFFKCSEESNAK